MDIHQLSAALERATGGQQWTEEDGSSSFEALAATLGEPDHIERIDRDLEPSMLFVKFLGDAARAVCEDMKDADLAAPEAERLLLRHVTPEDDLQSNPEGVEANLRYLLLRFHSRDLPEGSAQLQPWLDLFEASLTPPVGEEPADPASAWRTVCVGLVIHPNFYSY